MWLRTLLGGFLLQFGMIGLFSIESYAQTTHLAPISNAGKRWRIGYYESGPLSTYQTTFKVVLQGLMENGWLEPTPLPDISNPLNTKALWEWAATNLKSDTLEFVQDQFWSANWSSEEREEIQEDLLPILQTEGTIDLIITMGTEAGMDLVKMDQKVPILAMESPDPVKFGIVDLKQPKDHVFALVFPNRYQEQLVLFHQIYEFKTMGIIYENSPDGRIMAALADVEAMALEHGFKIIPCYALNQVRYISKAKSDVYDCVLELVDQGVGGVYLTQQRGIVTDNIGDLVNILHRNNIPTFSQTGAELVKYGVLLTKEPYSRQQLGHFYANVIAQHFNGKALGEITQDYPFLPRIVLNQGVSKRYNFDIPFDILSIADTIYRNVLRP